MALAGNLKDMSLTSIISVNCNEMNQARLVIHHGDEEAAIYFDGGNIVHIALGSREGAELIRDLLKWEDGEFALEMGVPAPRHTVRTPWSTLLLEGIQRVDEDNGQAQAIGTAEGSLSDSPNRVAAALRAIAGVQGVVLMARDGVILAADLEGDPEKEGAVAVYVGAAASQIGENLALGAFERALVQTAGSGEKLLVMEKPDYYVGVLVSERASAALVAAQAATILNSPLQNPPE